MTPNSPSPPGAQPPLPPAPSQPPKKRSRLAIGRGVLLGLLLVVVATVFIAIWWVQRPIRPVVLSAREKAEVDSKLEHLHNQTPATPPPGTISRPPKAPGEAAQG